MNEIEKLTELVIKFRDKRDWKKFHNPKDCALSLVLEAAEVMEHFQWKNGDQLKNYIKTNKNEIAEELADVLYWILLIANDLNIDIGQAIKNKLIINNMKYPVKKSKGNAKKYTNLV